MQAQLGFSRFGRERLVLVLIALATLGFTHPANTQDETRLSLTQSLLEHGEVTIDRYGRPTDRARRDGRLYTDKAPGISLLAVPAVALVRAGERVTGKRTRLVWEAPVKLWFIRVLVVGPFLLALAWLVGRVAEGLVAGSGAPAALVTALATILGPLASILFAHVPAAFLCFAAFVVAARSTSGRSALVAGALAGAAVVVEYQAALVVVPLALYVAARLGAAGLVRFCAGGLPGVAVLGVYNLAAFGSPFRLSYQYIDGAFASQQESGFFGIGTPRLESLASTLLGDRGLLTVSPVLAAAAVGLCLLWRRGRRAEVLLAVAVAALYLALESGYFLPYGGYSPGPRFFAPALPFLLLGLPGALAWRPRLVTALIVASIVLCTADALTWPSFAPGVDFDPKLPATLLSEAGAPRAAGVAIVCSAALAAIALTVLERPRHGLPAIADGGQRGASNR